LRTLAGPNVHSPKPVLVLILDLGGQPEAPPIADAILDRLASAIPGLDARGLRQKLESVHDGPAPHEGHLVEAAALELARSAELPARRAEKFGAGEPDVHMAVFEFTAEHATRYLIGEAVELVSAVLRGEKYDVAEVLDEARRIAARTELGPSTRAIVDAAERRGIPWRRVSDGSLVQLGYGKHRKFIQAATGHSTCQIAVDIASDKHLTKSILAQASIPVPRGRVVRSEAEARAALLCLRPPLVVKPLDGHQGKGVSLNLTGAEEVCHAFHLAREHSAAVLVEEALTGRDYRVLVVDGRMVAASERKPAHVVGDGAHTIAELIEIANRDPRRGEGHEKPLTRLTAGSIVCAFLAKRGLGLDSVPAEGEEVLLRESANLSKGGTARDVTELVHPSVARVCERAVRLVGLDVCGVDLVLEDISQPIRPGRGGIVELNAAPGLRMHLFPSEGEPRDVGGAIVDMLYPDGEPSRVPIISVTGTNGKTIVTRMIAHALAAGGMTAGVTTSGGVFIGGERVAEGDTTGPQSARLVLSDPAVEVAVLETARGGLARRGLAYDWSDVAVVTNVQPDHIGQDGIRSLDDLLRVKSLVAERVREGGSIVLNADDERLARLPETAWFPLAGRKIVYFSLYDSSLVVRRHLSRDGAAFYLRGDGWIVEAHGHSEQRVVRASAIPATLGGTAQFNVANAIAAIAACRANGVDRKVVAAALAAFEDDARDLGRTALYRVGEGYVLLDYGHNPDGYRAVRRMASAWHGRPTTGIVSAPGDRPDETVEEIGRVAGGWFDRVLVTEEADTRGRVPGEVAEVLRAAVMSESPGRDCRVVLDRPQALAMAIRDMRLEEVVVCFYDEPDAIVDVLERHGAVRVSGVEELELRPRLSA
jgi:cyanophycin synthetase